MLLDHVGTADRCGNRPAAADAKTVEFEGILGHMDDVIAETQRQRAYLKLSPGNDPAYRIIRDSKRLEVAEALEEAAVKSYLAARRAEYEYGARLSASGFRISDIYRARTGSEIIVFLDNLRGVTEDLAGTQNDANLNVKEFNISVVKHVLGLTDAALAKEGFTTRHRAGRARAALTRLGCPEHRAEQLRVPLR